MNIDFVKFLVQYANGFEWIDRENEDYEVGLPENNTFLCSWCNHFKTDRWKQIYYPLLLQRAIEGINKGNTGYWFVFEMNNIEVYSNSGLCDGWMRVNIDESKEQALKYIYEQEKNND